MTQTIAVGEVGGKFFVYPKGTDKELGQNFLRKVVVEATGTSVVIGRYYYTPVSDEKLRIQKIIVSELPLAR